MILHRNKNLSIPSITKSNNKSLFNTFSEGFAFGAGSQLAHTAINNIVNQPIKSETHLDKNNIYKIYEECLSKKDEYHKEECFKILDDISKN